MRHKRGQSVPFDLESEAPVRTRRRSQPSGSGIDAAREAWEPIACPECGTDHPDTVAIRLKRTGRDITARCADCGTVAARFIAGVWTS